MPDETAQAPPRPAILILGRDAVSCDLLAHVLTAEGYRVYLQPDEQAGTEPAKLPKIDLAVYLPARDGNPASGLQQLGERLTSAGTPILSFHAGAANGRTASTCSRKTGQQTAQAPGTAKLLADVRATLKAARTAGNQDMLFYADVILDTSSYRVARAGEDVHLTPTEFRLLRHLLTHPEQVFTRQQLARAAWPRRSKVGQRTVDVHVGRLRRALRASDGRDPIRTVRSIGYAFTAR